VRLAGRKSPGKSFWLAIAFSWSESKIFKVRSLNAKFLTFVLALLIASVISSYFVTIHTINKQVRESIVKRAESLAGVSPQLPAII